MLNDGKFKFILGNCLDEIKKIDSESIDCIITSPPYWGMRKYDNDEHIGMIGNEDNPNEYVYKLVEIFNEAKRVLKKEGSLWLNLGDKYHNKNLMGMPWRVALAMMDNGWILRNDIIWNQLKGTQSSKDRLRDSYEHIFHFVKSKKYFYDADAIRIKPTKVPKIVNGKLISATGVSGVRYKKIINESIELTEQEKVNALQELEKTLSQVKDGEIVDFRMTIRGAQRAWHSDDVEISGRAKELLNKGFYIMRMGAKGPLPTDIWDIVPEDTWRKDNHYAVFPEELLKTPILATCPINGIVLDPFSGTGSTVIAALKLGRQGIGIELSPQYLSIAQSRLLSYEKNQ